MNPIYTKGFNAGYTMGYRSGLEGSAARTVMNRDLIWAYGCMALVLIESHGWSADDVESLINEIQKRWEAVGTDTSTDDMAEYVRVRTGIELEQKAEEIIKL